MTFHEIPQNCIYFLLQIQSKQISLVMVFYSSNGFSLVCGFMPVKSNWTNYCFTVLALGCLIQGIFLRSSHPGLIKTHSFVNVQISLLGKKMFSEVYFSEINLCFILINQWEGCSGGFISMIYSLELFVAKTSRVLHNFISIIIISQQSFKHFSMFQLLICKPYFEVYIEDLFIEKFSDPLFI